MDDLRLSSSIIWRMTIEALGEPVFLSDNMTNEDALAVADCLSRKYDCIVLIQKIKQCVYGEEEVTWQRYLINGLDSFRPDNPRKADAKNAPAIPKKRQDIRPAARAEAPR